MESIVFGRGRKDFEEQMTYEIVAVGKIKEKFLVDAISEYKKRLSKFCELKVTEIKALDDVKAEGFEILSKLDKRAFFILLSIDGKALGSEDFANFLSEKKLEGFSHIVFVIGGSLGVSEDVGKKADYKLLFSSFTFPHQLMRLIFLEQLYRAETIINHLPYHK